MAAGIILTQQDADNVVGGLARDVHSLMVRIPLIRTKIVALAQAGLVALPQGGRVAAMTSDDASALMSAMDELNNFAGVFVGTNVVATDGAVSAGTGHDFRAYLTAIEGFVF